METLRVLRTALLAGILAGAITAGFHFVLTEPVIEQAIAAEPAGEAMAAHGEAEEPVVSREGQRAGLFLGYTMYGITWGLFFGAAFTAWGLARRRAADTAIGWRMAALAAWAVGVVPALKYPANPPGVGNPETIDIRLAWFLALLVLSVTGTVVASLAAGRWFSRSRDVATAALCLAWGALLIVALPANPDAVDAAASLLGAFRALSLAGTLVFWVAFAAAFAWLIRPTGAPALATSRS
jgi:hypothetical protein